MPPLVDTRDPLLKSYLLGFVFALVLTAIPFGLVALKLLPAVPTLAVIAVLASVQMIVHLRYFLHLDLSPKRRESLFALAFAAVIVFIMVGGTVWILFNLQYRMMV